MKAELIESVKRVQNGDNEAFSALYAEYAKSVYFQVSNIVHNKQDIDDIVSSIFITAFEKIGDLKSPDAFSAWLNKIAMSKSMDYLRREQKKFTDDIETGITADALEDFEEIDPKLIPDKALDDAETAQIIYEIVQGLTLPQRSCIFLYYYEGKSVSEIAEMLAVSENTVKTRLSLARAKIKDELEKRGEKDGIRLWMATPLILTPVLEIALQGTQVPATLAGNVMSALGIGAKTAATTGAATTTGTAVSTKIIAGAAASVIITGSIITGVVLLSSVDEEVPVETPPAIVESTPSPTPTSTPEATVSPYIAMIEQIQQYLQRLLAEYEIGGTEIIFAAMQTGEHQFIVEQIRELMSASFIVDRILYISESGNGIGLYIPIHLSSDDYINNSSYIYVGDYDDNVRSGKGIWIPEVEWWIDEFHESDIRRGYSQYTFTGEWLNDCPNGFGEVLMRTFYFRDAAGNGEAELYDTESIIGSLADGKWNGDVDRLFEYSFGPYYLKLSYHFTDGVPLAFETDDYGRQWHGIGTEYGYFNQDSNNLTINELKQSLDSGDYGIAGFANGYIYGALG